MANSRNTRTKRVLVGSADTILLDRLARVLREAHCNVASTQRSGRLLYRALEDPFDLVILDLDLKDLNGLEALQILRRARPKLPVVVVSAVLREREARQLAGEDVIGHLLKPIDVEDLAEAVRLAASVEIAMNESKGGGLL
jgi:DNA-binding NarL/FixJ family response regulator